MQQKKFILIVILKKKRNETEKIEKYKYKKLSLFCVLFELEISYF